MSVCVCVCVCVRESACVCERECVCVCLWPGLRSKDGGSGNTAIPELRTQIACHCNQRFVGGKSSLTAAPYLPHGMQAIETNSGSKTACAARLIKRTSLLSLQFCRSSLTFPNCINSAPDNSAAASRKHGRNANGPLSIIYTGRVAGRRADQEGVRRPRAVWPRPAARLSPPLRTPRDAVAVETRGVRRRRRVRALGISGSRNDVLTRVAGGEEEASGVRYGGVLKRPG